MKITLQQIRDHSPCRNGWTELLKTLNTDDMTTKVTIGQIARSNGAQDALWCLRCGGFDQRDVVRSILPAVKRASVHTTDNHIHDCIAALERWLDGDDTVDLRSAANAAADAAARTTWAASAAARAVRAAARTTYAANAVARAVRAATCAAYAARAVDADTYTAEQQKQIEDICEVFG